ncbi:MAG: EAL domain-containing protein [Thiohalocapsa sp.]
MDIALQSGLMREIDQLVLNVALRDVAALRHRTGMDLRLAIEVAAEQLDDADFEVILGDLLEQNKFARAALNIEITKHALSREPRNGRDLMGRLQHQGIRITLDDVGFGGAALTRLRDAPVDEIKLDRRLVRGIPDDAVDCAVVEGILGIAKKLGLIVVANGVQAEAQRSSLAKRGCELLQGYFYGKPARIGDIDPKTLRTPPQSAQASAAI